MKTTAKAATYEIEVGPGECLRLPDEVARQFEEGVWVLTVRSKSLDLEHFRDHTAFLSGYSDEDEGLYDDDVSAG